MKLTQSNFLNMIKAVCTLFTNRKEVWINKPVIDSSFVKINNLCARIQQEAMMQEQNKTKGYTAEKYRQRATLEERMFRFATRLKVYAEHIDDGVTAIQMTYSRTQLNKFSLNALITRAYAILETVERLNPIPEMYEITEADFEELQNSIRITEQINAHRDVVLGEHSENTASLGRLFTELRMEIKRMDTQVEAYIDDKDFARTYFFTRRIHDVRGGSRKKE